MILKRKEIIYFFLFAFLFISVVSVLSENRVTHEFIKALHFTDALFIFKNNLEYTMLMLLFSITGLNLLLIIKVLIIFGQGPSLAGINPLIYYASSITHGVGELIVCCIIFYFTINQIRVVVGYFFGKKDIKDVKLFYISFIKCQLPLIILTLFISSLAEVFISNRLIKIFLY